MASDEKKRKLSECLPDLFAETLECPVCLETIRDPPVFLCANGHELCHKCREPLKAEDKPCPVCQEELLDVRNRAVEKMLDKLPKTKCAHEGCTFAKADGQLVKNHEKDCNLRPVKCEGCKKPIALSQLYEHLVVNHQFFPSKLTGFGVKNECVKQISLAKSPHGLFGPPPYPLWKVDNDLMFIYNWSHFDSNLTMFWISFSGTQKEAEKYEYTLKILSSADGTKYHFSGSRKCMSCEVSHEEMKKKGGALFLNKDLLETAGIDNGQFLDIDWSLVIKKM